MLKTFYKNRRPEEGKKKLWNNIIQGQLQLQLPVVVLA